MNEAVKKYKVLENMKTRLIDKNEELKDYLKKNTKDRTVSGFIFDFYDIVDDYLFDSSCFLLEFTSLGFYKVEVGKEIPREMLENGVLSYKNYYISFDGDYFDGYCERYNLIVEIDSDYVVTNIRRNVDKIEI